MKKMKKEKKKKEQTKRRWPIWLTILLAILGVGAISGVTVLGVYLAGGFAENIINPADIYFSYDENLYNDSTSQLEVTDDFTLMVDTSSGYVTEDEVTLSFSDSSRVTQREINGVIYIDNGVIQVKQTVRIREEFTVTLMRADLLGEDNEVLAEDWIKGGIANLVATSEYNQIPATAPLQIAVDVPVWGIEIASVNSSGKETDQIVTGENFTVRTRYIPEASQYIYSDDQNSAIAQENKRVKHTYYVADAGQYASAITTRYDDQYSVSFLAGNQTVDNITLRGYTFRHADDQIENENNAETVTDEAFYTQILGVLLSSGDDTMTFDMQDISIGMASVGRFTVSKSSQTISLNTEQSLRLYMNEYLYDDNSNYLGVNVYSTSGGLLEGMLPNIAINFSYNSTDPTIDSFMQVIDGDYVEVDGLRYYMPYSNVTNLNYSYWTIRSLREANVTMTVVLLIENENGGYSLFGEPLTYTVTLSVSEHVEEPLSWTSTEDIDVMLNYNSTSGNFGSYTIENLNSLKQIPSQNIYQDYRFFAYFGEGSKEDLRATVDSIIGPTGYNYDLSGIYATTENLLLFALNGTSITLQNSGSFRLYFGTIVTENNIPVYETDGEGNRTYRIAVMSQDYILVNCEKSLYQDSVSVGEVNTDAFTPLENGEFAIDQGNTDTLAVSFRVDSEAVSVFTDEYYSGYMSLVVRDRQNNDITTNFTVLSSQLTEEAETGDSILTYQIMVNTGANISELNGIYLSQFALRYDNTNGDVIEWTMPINDKTISIYSPEAQSIEVNTTNNQEFADYVNGNAPITVNQTLGVDGNFLTSITAGEEFASVDELLTALLGANNIYVIVTDQNGRVDTLSDSWRFALVEGSDSNVINLNGQTFTFRQADNAEVGLALVTIDGNASSLDSNQRLNFIVTSVGITNAESLSSWDPYPATTYDDEDYSQSDISNLAVTLYGAKPSGTQTNGGLITLADLVKFYIGEGTENQPYERYTRIRFTLSQQYLNDTTLTDEMIIDLFNNVNGMIILYDENGDIISGLPSDNAQTIKQRLSGQELSAIAFRNNFAIDHIIRFSITDTGANGAINSTLNLTIRAAYTVTAYNYPEDIRQPLYASVATEITNTVTNNYLRYIENESYTNTFASLYSATNGIDVDKSNTYYIVSRGSGYILINEDDFTLGTAYVGTFDRLSGEITFIDFWNTETRDYSITFTPEGENYFTFERVILFTVTRDLGVEGKDNTYYLINDSGASYTVEDFISTYRLSNRANLPNSLSLVYEFDNYFTVLSSADTQDHPIVKADDSPLLFDYNQKQLSTTLIVYYVNEGDGQRVELGRETIPIEIYSETLQEPSESYDIYSDIAEMITYQSDDTISAQVQNVGDTEYIMVQQGAWRLSSNFVTINSSRYRVYPSLVNLSGSTMLNYYEIGNYDDTLGTYINFFNNSSRIYQNVDDIGNPLYLVVFFVSPNDGNSPTFPGTTAVMYIPIIITSIGYNYVNYDESMVSENEKFATAITDPNSYIVGGVYTGPYQTIKAGQVSTIMKQYNFTDKDLSTGLYLINGIGYSYTASITYHPLTSSPQLSTSEDIIKGTVIESIDGQQVGTISLNHLSSVYQNFYFAVKYTISSTSESKDFYYVYKVEPDVIVEDPVYAYNHNSQGASEYLQGEQYQTGSVNFNEIFGGTTLAENQKRFNITKQFEIVSVVNEDASDQTTEPLTEIEINLTSEKMQLWIAVLNGDNVLYERSTPYTVKKPEDSNNIIIDLASIFDESANIIAGNTINLSILSGSGEIYYNDTMIFASLNETNEIESVTVGEDLYYDQEGWGQFIEIYFSSDNATMYYRPLTSEQITIIVKHSYNGGADEKQLSIIGGVQYYQFVLNSANFNYSVRFTEGNSQFITTSNNQTYTWDDVIIDSENSSSINVHLLQGVDAGSTGYEEIWDRLHIALTGETSLSGEEVSESALDFAKGDDDSVTGNKKGFSYDASRAGAGKLTLYFTPYILSARTLEFTIYTEQGYLATLYVEVDATASYEVKKDAEDEDKVLTDLTGGGQYNFGDIFDIKLNDGSIDNSNYSVTGSVTGKVLSSTEYQNFAGEDFVKFENENGLFIVANLLRDYEVNFQFTIIFKFGEESDLYEYDGKEFSFVATLTLKRNITYNTSVNGGNVIAGEETQIREIAQAGVSGIFNTINSTINTTIQYTGSSTSQAFNTIDGKNIITNYVANQTSADINLMVRVYFTYNDSGINDDTPYQEFNMTYSLTIYPSVQITPNYPVPDGEELDREYIDSKSVYGGKQLGSDTYTNMLSDFFFHSAIFSDQTRLAFAPAVKEDNGTITYDKENLLNITGDNLLDADDLTITVYSLQNASVFATTGTGESAVERHYASSETLPNDATNLKLQRGTYTTSSDDQSSIVDDMGTSFIRFRITYQNVQAYYDVYLLDSSLSVQINNVTKNTDSGQYEGGEIVGYETSFIDQTNLTNNMFAKNRMAQVTYSSTLSRNGSYYLVFSVFDEDANATYYYASYSQYLTSTDAGMTAYLDLGYSMTTKNGETYTDFTYVGTYSISNFENNNLTTKGNGRIVKRISSGEGDNVSYTFEPVTSTSDFGTNFDSNNAIFESVNLTNRVQLIYGGMANINVDYKYFDDYLEELQLSKMATTDVDTIKGQNVFKTDENFDKNDGSNASTEEFDTIYYYMPTIDIDIDGAISSSLNLEVLEVNNEYPSMVSEFGVRHPSTGQLVNAGDFGADKASLELYVVGKDDVDETDTATIDLLNRYLSTYNESEFKIMTSAGSREYLRPSAITNAGQYAYDYRLLPLGADNQGDLVLIKITYRVQLQQTEQGGTASVTKDFYVVVRVVPDYILSFGGNTVDFTEEQVEGDEVSNINNPYSISSNTFGDYYDSFKLTKSIATDESGYVSVKHANGDTAVRNAEIATSGFTITLPVTEDIIVDGVKYNDAKNVEQKLAYDGGDLSESEDKWTLSGDVYTLNSGATTEFTSVKQVIFGTQYYKIEAQDDYGFKYAVYFSLVSQYDEPYISATNITLTENGKFDIGAQFDVLNVSTITNDDNTQYNINPAPTNPIATDPDVALVEVLGIQAHLFAGEPSGLEKEGAKDGYGYSPIDSSQWPNYSQYLSQGYFDVPLINFVRVDSINFYDSNNVQVVNNPIDLSSKDYTLATATKSQQGDSYVFNGYTSSEASSETSSETSSSGANRDVYTSDDAQVLTVPRITSTDVFADSNQAEVQMVIRLKYQSGDGDVVEYYDLTTPVTIVREVSITTNSDATPVRDGVPFNVSCEFVVNSGEGGAIADATYINDTLEVLVRANRDTTFQLQMVRDGITYSARVPLSNGRTVARTEYISISQQLGINVREDETVTIIPQDTNAEFYYITNDGINIVNNHFVPATNEDNQLAISASTGTYYVNRVWTDTSGVEQQTPRDITVSTIDYDAVYIEDVSLINNSNHYYNVRKYYVVNVTFTDEESNTLTYTYRTSKSYYVTGYYYTLERAEQGTMVMNLLKATSRDENGNIYSEFSEWYGAFTMTTADSSREAEPSSDNKNNYKDYLRFTIDTTSDPNASGNASIDSNNIESDTYGRITYNSRFNVNEYLRIVINMRVSGADRKFGTTDDTFLLMDTLRLGWAEDYNQTINSTT